MPVYDYRCDRGHMTEERRGLDDVTITCPRPRCQSEARRAPIYHSQYMQAETGPVGGKKNPVDPKDENLGPALREFQEAADEVNYEYEKAERQTGVKQKRRNVFQEAKDIAHRKDQRIKAGSGESRIGK